MKTFIARIAHNRAVDHVLKESRYNKNISAEEYIEGADDNQSVSDQDEKIDLMTGLYRLALGHRQIISMQLEGFTHIEISEILGLTESAVAKRASRARQLLEKWL